MLSGNLIMEMEVWQIIQLVNPVYTLNSVTGSDHVKYQESSQPCTIPEHSAWNNFPFPVGSGPFKQHLIQLTWCYPYVFLFTYKLSHHHTILSFLLRV